MTATSRQIRQLRAVLVEGARAILDKSNPDPAIVSALLTAEDEFYRFDENFSNRKLSSSERICRSAVVRLADRVIRLYAYNTALLSQRTDRTGTLTLPSDLTEAIARVDPDADVSISIYHHPESWLESTFKRKFRKLVESTSHFVFTGHEHLRDGHWTETSSGERVTYIEADALQDESSPLTSGFSCTQLDFEEQLQKYYRFEWKGDRYTAVVDGEEKTATLVPKTAAVFNPVGVFYDRLTEDDFGFTHPYKSKLLLSDIFVWPDIMLDQQGKTAPKRVKGKDLFNRLLTLKYVYLRGADRHGKTSLLRTFYSSILNASTLIPVMLSGDDLTSSREEAFFAEIWAAVRKQYGVEAIEPFKQLPAEKRVLLIDDLHRTRVGPKPLIGLLAVAKREFGIVVITSNKIPTPSEFASLEENDGDEPLLVTASIRELPPSSRAQIIDKWLRLGQPELIDEAAHARALEREQSMLNDLIKKQTLPALPYLVVGVLQIRHNRADEVIDPGSFGYLFQKLVIDALSVSTTKDRYIERKDGILRRFAARLYELNATIGSAEDFDFSVAQYVSAIKLRVNGKQILGDLIAGRVLTEIDGNLSFKHPYFFHYFLARHLIDELESDRSAKARSVLDKMADRPLAASNRLTLIFFLFFKKRDQIIDKIISQANETFRDMTESDIISDVKFIDDGLEVPAGVEVDEEVDVEKHRKRRYESQDDDEQSALAAPVSYNEMTYSDSLDSNSKITFALARIELLGQVIRNFSGSLEGDRKVEILESVFKLGLRMLHHTLAELSKFLGLMRSVAVEDKDLQERLNTVINTFVPLAARLCCDSILLTLSRAVGVPDIEEVYEEAARRVGDTCATILIDLAIKLDHSEGFPLRELDKIHRRVSKESRLATSVLADIVVRNTQIFPLHRETLRKIAGILNVDHMKLLQGSGSIGPE